jgi:Leucine-rich repeat (LRR) protein
LAHHSNLQELLLAGNRLQRIGSGLAPLTQLRRLDLCSNCLKTCDGLQGGS